MEICTFCGNKNFHKTTTQYTYKRDGHFMIVEDVPCEQCDYCGEQYFSAQVLRQIESEFEAIYLKGKKVKRSVVVPVESYSNLVIT